MKRWYIKEKGPGVNEHKGHERQPVGDVAEDSPVDLREIEAEEVLIFSSVVDDDDVKLSSLRPHAVVTATGNQDDPQVIAVPDPLRGGRIQQQFSLAENRPQLDALYTEVASKVTTQGQYIALQDNLLQAKETIERLDQQDPEQDRHRQLSELVESAVARKRPRGQGDSSDEYE